FKEIRTLGCDYGGWHTAARGAERGGVGHYAQMLLSDQAMHAFEAALRVVVQLAGFRRAIRMDASVRHDAMARGIRYGRQAHGGHAAGPHRLADRTERQVVGDAAHTDDAAG